MNKIIFHVMPIKKEFSFEISDFDVGILLSGY
jgi:hypothetical protein